MKHRLTRRGAIAAAMAAPIVQSACKGTSAMSNDKPVSLSQGQLSPVFVGHDAPSGEFAEVLEHFEVLVGGMTPTYFDISDLQQDPPVFTPLEPLNTRLARLLARSFPIRSQMPEGTTECTPAPIGNIYGEWIRSEAASWDRRMLYLHGGGYALGDVDSYRCFIARLSKASGAAVYAIDYRLAPEHPFPAALEDAIQAYDYLGSAKFGNGDTPEKVYVVGDSAGGGLALATTLKVMETRRDLPDAVMAMSPATDLSQSGSTLTPPEIIGGGKQFAMYAGEAGPYHPLVSPLYAELEGFPPLLLQAGEVEGYLDDSTRFYQKAHEAGVDVTFEVWRHMPHVHQVMAPVLPEANEAIEHIGHFLRAH